MFLPVGESTVIDRIFTELEADQRISEVFVSTNARFAETFKEYLASHNYEKPRLSVEETTEEDEKFGVVGALEQLIEREEISDDLLVIAGDNLISFEIAEFVDFFNSSTGAALAAYDVGSIDRAQSYGVVDLEDSQVVGFEEKPDRPASTLISIACYGFPAETLPMFRTYLDGGNNPDEPGWFIKWLKDQTPVYAFTFDEAWFDIGTPESYLDAVRWALDGESLISEDATIEDSEIGENVHVMSGATIRASRLEDSIIFTDSSIRNCELRECIIDRETDIAGIDLSGALIGAHTQITNGR